jgi:S1-C subfamily serine protease
MDNSLTAVSDRLVHAVQKAGRSVVALDTGRRFPSSGIWWRPGIIVTAEHALRRDEEIGVHTAEGKAGNAVLAGRDAGTDVAVLKMEDDGAGTVVEFAPDKTPDPGELILAVGRSQDSGVNATLGIISAVGKPWRTWRGGRLDRYIRLDLTLYPGSSGAAVVNGDGQIIGMATSALSRLAGVAVPVSTVDRVVDEILAKGHVSRSYLGVALQPVTIADHLRRLGLEGSTGLILLSVDANGPAGRGGLQIGDILIALDGKRVQHVDDVQNALESRKPAENALATILRGGEHRELTVTLGEQPGRD